MGYDFTLADVAYLTSAEAASALTEVGGRELSARTRLADIGWARTRFGDRAALLVETALARRKAVGKLPDAGNWLLTDDAVQQATPAVVAAHRARRLTGRAVHDVTCSIGAELAALTGVAQTVIGSDLDPVRLAMAAHN
ncbi:MAG: class I SAM-dependent methyltransferase, partial [Rhodococcus sp. (in: high G+C Gram-positive bacteria)]